MSVKAQRGNKIIRISEDSIQLYLNKGFNIIGESGAVIEKAVPRDTNQLIAEVKRQDAEITDLKAKIKDLEEANAKLQSEIDKAAVAISEKPSRKRKADVSEESDTASE